MPRLLDTHRSSAAGVHSNRFWLFLLGIIVIAFVLRLAFFHGPLGSDDNVYLTRALSVALGQWPSSDYIGALRYGFNIPAGFFVWLFGPSLFVANLYPFLLSIAEITVVGVLARRPLGERAALIAALLLAFLPLHIGRATALHADAVLAFFLTLSFALFWGAWRRDHWAWWVAAGLAVGMVYWVKEVVIIFALVFFAYAVLMKRWSWGYCQAGAAAVFLFLLSCALMWAIEGDPLHVLNVVRASVEKSYIDAPTEKSPLFYLKYLFFLIYHSWILGYLALAGLFLFMVGRRTLTAEKKEFLTYGVFWLLGMLVVFSLLPISFSPFTLIAKQSNYLNMFFAPLVLLAAFLIAQLHSKLQILLVTIFLSGGILLAGLAQQDLRAFVANGKALHHYAVQKNMGPIYGSQRNHGLSIILARASQGIDAVIPVLPVSLLFEPDYIAAAPNVLVAHDPVTHRAWTEGYDAKSIPACWDRVGQLQPRGFGMGQFFSRALLWIVELAPRDLSSHLSSRLRKLNMPQPAVLYRVPTKNPLCDK